MTAARRKIQVVVAGHTCLDIIPDLSEWSDGLDSLFVPGKLVNVGSALIATGGAVPNTGLALHRLGIEVALMGKIGRDLFGRGVLDFLTRHDPVLADGMIVSDSDATSYTVVINPPGVDRIFLHCPGANDTFSDEDVNYDKLTGVKLFHFGYPPLLRQMYLNGGRKLETILHRVKDMGITTSLDTSRPDPASEAGRLDWIELLERILPHVDVFPPSIDEILFMLDRERYDNMQRQAGNSDVTSLVDGELLAGVAQQLLDMGVAVVVLKLGDQGLYLRTTAEASRLDSAGAGMPLDRQMWVGRELLAPCFDVNVVGTTGAGDCTIAGFLAGLLHGDNPEQAMTSAVATGACNVEAADATSGVPPWDKVQSRIAASGKRRAVTLTLNDWKSENQRGVFAGPNDKMTKP